MSGYGLSDNIGRARKWQFPQGTTINPGEYKVIWCDGDTALSNAGELHTSFKLKKSGGEVLVLADPTGKILDKVVLPEIPTNVSYGRSIGREGFFYYDMATAGAQNGNDTFLGYADAPELTLQPGKHYGTVTAGFTIPAQLSTIPPTVLPPRRTRATCTRVRISPLPTPRRSVPARSRRIRCIRRVP